VEGAPGGGGGGGRGRGGRVGRGRMMRGLRQDKVENGEVGYNQLPPHWIMGRDPASRPSRSPSPLPSFSPPWLGATVEHSSGRSSFGNLTAVQNRELRPVNLARRARVQETSLDCRRKLEANAMVSSTLFTKCKYPGRIMRPRGREKEINWLDRYEIVT
jgi:hypothetical protein